MSEVARNGGPVEEVRVLEARVTELEIKASFAEDLLDQLNHTIFRQQQQIEQLARDVAELRQRIPPDMGAPNAPRDELPPHY